jgi:lipopolysaccharide heptosyltransferase I
MTRDPGEKPRRVLVILMGALGDVVRGLSIVTALKSAEPDLHLTWLVEPACAGIVSLHPNVDEVVIFNRKEGLRGVWKLKQELSKRVFDVTLDLQRHAKSGLFSWFSGAPRRIGFNRKDAKEGNWLFNNEHIPARGDSISKIDHYFLFLEHLGVAAPECIDGGLSHLTLESVNEEVRGEVRGPYVGLILGSSRYSKDWPEEGYAALIEQASLPGISTIVLLGDPSKREMSERLMRTPSRLTIVNSVGRTSLRDLVGLIHGARVCVGPDSGPAHIAGSLGVPHVTLFGPTPSERNAPRGSEGLSIRASLGCSPCRRRVCPGLDKLCMRLISPAQVLERISSAL